MGEEVFNGHLEQVIEKLWDQAILPMAIENGVQFSTF